VNPEEFKEVLEGTIQRYKDSGKANSLDLEV
jgi:hypothetical protein